MSAVLPVDGRINFANSFMRQRRIRYVKPLVVWAFLFNVTLESDAQISLKKEV
jgi:hypothetical protein